MRVNFHIPNDQLFMQGIKKLKKKLVKKGMKGCLITIA